MFPIVSPTAVAGDTCLAGRGTAAVDSQKGYLQIFPDSMHGCSPREAS